jgi:hypothetical protein
MTEPGGQDRPPVSDEDVRDMRAAVQLPAFLLTKEEANSPSYALRADLTKRLAAWRPVSQLTRMMTQAQPTPSAPLRTALTLVK